MNGGDGISDMKCRISKERWELADGREECTGRAGAWATGAR